MKIDDLFDPLMFEAALVNRYVRMQRHPTRPSLVIVNYSPTCQFAGAWDDVTRTCRGLVYDLKTGEVLARPFPKFFGVNEAHAARIDPGAAVEVTDKLDGSLGIIYPGPDGWAVATRGSFDSAPARHASRVLRTRYSKFEPRPGLTYLVEIIYPGNRVVCDYGAMDDLILLGVVDTETGFAHGPHEPGGGNWDWPGLVVESFTQYPTYAEALAAPNRRGAEGFVVRETATGAMVKIKQSDYVALHRILTECSAMRLWSHLAVLDCRHVGPASVLTARLHLDPADIEGILAVGDDWIEPLLANKVPAEFQKWVTSRVAEMNNAVRYRKAYLGRLLRELVGVAFLTDTLPERTKENDRLFSEAARLFVTNKADYHLVMGLWNRQNINGEIWLEVRPAHELPFKATDEEDAA